ncbi:TetR family transcriptional regulator [Saccharopolyspora sp. 5N708]|uniref:TetR family transcriptional regulator n=1 Tax=Saccharopolyspora sp. 5N708 TaxID=3457424 RepID=UPI003FD43A61
MTEADGTAAFRRAHLEVTGKGETAARLRTRRAILDAAVGMLGKDASASLADIAAAAGVGRTTLHRYFPDRSHLLAALSAVAADKITAATADAAPEHGTAPQALDRLCQQLFELGDLLMLVFNDQELVTCGTWDEDTDADRTVLRIVERGHDDGTIDPELDGRWIQQVLWAVLYSAWQHTRCNGAPKHAALSMCLRTLRKAVSA